MFFLHLKIRTQSQSDYYFGMEDVIVKQNINMYLFVVLSDLFRQIRNAKHLLNI